jgi:hypothetical protein
MTSQRRFDVIAASWSLRYEIEMARFREVAPMTSFDAADYEAIRMVVGGLISVAIALLSLVMFIE